MLNEVTLLTVVILYYVKICNSGPSQVTHNVSIDLLGTENECAQIRTHACHKKRVQLLQKDKFQRGYNSWKDIELRQKVDTTPASTLM